MLGNLVEHFYIFKNFLSILDTEKESKMEICRGPHVGKEIFLTFSELVN